MKRFSLPFLTIVAAALFAGHAEAQLIIANPGFKASDIAKGELKEVFTGVVTSLKDGSHVTPVILKASPTQDEFLLAYIGKADAAFRATWRNLVFSGEATMPKQMESDAAMVEYVAHTPGAVGYIANSSPHDGVKVLAVK
jgi:hypothetical protein